MKFTKTLALLTGLAVLSPATAIAAPAAGTELAKSEISIIASISTPAADLDRMNAKLAKAEKTQATAAMAVAKKEAALTEKQHLTDVQNAYAAAQIVLAATEEDLAVATE